jgi:molybdopterin converting factor small subunit
MPILVPHADLAVVLGVERVESEARTVAELLEEVGRGVEPSVWKKATLCTVLLNGRNIHYLKGYATSLETDDVVWMVVPAGGG